MRLFWTLLVVLVLPAAWAQTDHDHLDSGRPLRMEDAEPIGFRARALEIGIASGRQFRGHVGVAMGLNLNGQLDLGADIGDPTHLELSYLYAWRAETLTLPAFATRFGLETSEQGTVYFARGILSRSVSRYGRAHVNFQVSHSEKETRLSGVLGVSHPIGYPTHFDTTGLAEIAWDQDRGLGLGVGIRRMVDLGAVLDLGIQADLKSPRDIRLVLGYSTAF